MIPYCNDSGVGLIPWSPIARGVLARPWNGIDKTSSLRSQHDPAQSVLYSVEDKATVDAVEEIAKARNLPMAAIATAWALSKGVNPILGLNSKRRIDEAILATKVQLSKEEVELLESGYRPKVPGIY